MIKMDSATVENICFQDKVPVILTTWTWKIYQRSSCLQGNMDFTVGEAAQRTEIRRSPL